MSAALNNSSSITTYDASTDATDATSHVDDITYPLLGDAEDRRHQRAVMCSDYDDDDNVSVPIHPRQRHDNRVSEPSSTSMTKSSSSLSSLKIVLLVLSGSVCLVNAVQILVPSAFLLREMTKIGINQTVVGVLFAVYPFAVYYLSRNNKFKYHNLIKLTIAHYYYQLMIIVSNISI